MHVGRCFAPLHEDLRTFFIIQVYIPVNVVKKLPTQRARDAGGGLWRPSRVARRMHATNSLTVRRDGSMTSAIALRHELRLPLLLGLLDNQSHNHEQMDVFHLLLG